MKYFIAFVILGGLYLYAFRGSPASAVVKPAAPPQRADAPAVPTTAASDFLKRPLDRTHEVLGLVRTRNEE